MPPAVPTTPRRAPSPLPAFAEPLLLIVAAILGTGVVYRVTLSIPVTLIAAALAGVVAVAVPTRHRVYLYPARPRDRRPD